ncbi:unnamed protein product [Penicillium roqueforti FM164]|uniref:Genomic scaffold, ProqFM164S01 n=1 Tax=Penicillium roqueforti (strain FM164) TaxID=1365484 RepID=W6PX96_PENRF|nr:unnamed protein product [Penicillium roqueforti FM164]
MEYLHRPEAMVTSIIHGSGPDCITTADSRSAQTLASRESGLGRVQHWGVPCVRDRGNFRMPISDSR